MPLGFRNDVRLVTAKAGMILSFTPHTHDAGPKVSLNKKKVVSLEPKIVHSYIHPPIRTPKSN